MMKHFLLVFFSVILLIVSNTFEIQAQFPLYNDPLYWKNRKPHAGYFQQDVHYKIDAVINEELHTISGKQLLQYYNNSNDTLREVFFHLYQNAFVKGAYTESLMRANQIKPRFGNYESNGLGIQVKDVKINNQPAAVEIDYTIMKVILPQALLPSSSISISMDFVSFFDMGSTRRRMKMYPAWGFMHYNGCQWFPKICVYDAKFGWDTYQHIGKEFYGNFGIYDVTLDFPSNYIVEATGALENRNIVLPDSLRALLDLKNFKDKPWNEPPSTIIPYNKGERKKWHYIAKHVHDFAFTADPSYRIATTYWNGIECVGIAQEPHASGWQNSADYVAKIIQTFSENYGQYYYPKMVAADAADGMEYPMITLDAGSDPGYRGLLVHEIGHNWFYGMVGNNETYRAALDEGFTQYLTAEGLKLIDGDTIVENKPTNWRKKFHEGKLAIETRVLYPYVYNTSVGIDHPLNTHSDDFNGAIHHGGGYAGVYYKSGTMLYQLRYILGDSLFNKALLHYFHQWKFAHPYFEDFRNSIIQFTKNDLNWFFDQWLETTKPLDYKIKRIKNNVSNKTTDITFKRKKGSMQMPIEFTTIDNTGKKATYLIPNTWYTPKPNITNLGKWIGWGKVRNTYTAIIPADNAIKHVMIDTSNLLADRYQLDNSKTKGSIIGKDKIITKLDIGNSPVNDRKHYRLYWRPNIWYNAIDGVKLGVTFDGAYLHNILKIQGSIWYNTTIGRWNQYLPAYNESIYHKYAPLNYQIAFNTPIQLNNPNTTVALQSKFIDGLWHHQLGINKQINAQQSIKIFAQMLFRNRHGNDYLLSPLEWSSNINQKNTSLNLVFDQHYKGFKSIGHLQATLRTPLLSNQFNYSYIQIENKWLTLIDKFIIKTRIFGRLGVGDKMPYESLLYLSGENPEQMMQNKFVRSAGFIPTSMYGYNTFDVQNFHHAGGLNLRGYNGYYAYDQRFGNDYLAYKGKSGLATNIEIDFSNYINLKPAITRNWLSWRAYAFFDAGIISLSDYNTQQYYQILPTKYWSDTRVDFGLGSVWTVKKWGKFTKAKPLSIRLDMPLFLNRPTFGNQNYFAPRWLVGVNMLF